MTCTHATTHMARVAKDVCVHVCVCVARMVSWSKGPRGLAAAAASAAAAHPYVCPYCALVSTHL